MALTSFVRRRSVSWASFKMRARGSPLTSQFPQTPLLFCSFQASTFTSNFPLLLLFLSQRHFIKQLQSMNPSASPPNPNPFSPYDGFAYAIDCSTGACSLYCPQWCYIIFPPPPPSADAESSAAVSPLVIALIAALASAFLLLAYYTVISRYCKRRRRRLRPRGDSDLVEEDRDEQQWQQSDQNLRGLEESVIKSITVCKYKRGDGLVDGTDCSVCLSEFKEEESLRLLPKCNHAFHVPCIDAWLKAHPNCPLCRSSIPIQNPNPSLLPSISPELRAASLQIQRRSSEAVTVVVDDSERVRREEIIVVITEEEDELQTGSGCRLSSSSSSSMGSSEEEEAHTKVDVKPDEKILKGSTDHEGGGENGKSFMIPK